MNREIKFRAWNGSKMLQQDEIAFTPGISTIAFRLSNMLELLLKDYSVMQFTGLFDKNGKEIYEGDILKVVGGMEGEIGIIEWNILKWNINWDYAKNLGKYDYNLTCKDELEIIGNIYENPQELIRRWKIN